MPLHIYITDIWFWNLTKQLLEIMSSNTWEDQKNTEGHHIINDIYFLYV